MSLDIDKTPAVPGHDGLPSMSKYSNHNAFNMFKAFNLNIEVKSHFIPRVGLL